MIFASLALTLLLAQGRPATTAASNDLAAVRELYASAAFEEALTRLSKVDNQTPQLEQYRALCLLGLGRTAEAQQSLERIVSDQPLYSITDTDVSPRLVTMFHTVRRRLLPAAARDLYLRAKKNLDDKKYVLASQQFSELLSILADDDMAEQATGFIDLKTLGEGFLKLTEEKLTEEAKAAPPPPPVAAPVAAPAPAPKPAAPVIYTDTDADVKPPIEIERKMPAWHPSGVLTRTGQFRGTLEVVVNERGLVETAVVRRSIAAQYDQLLLASAKDWKFQPAVRNGQPVKYRKTFDITLSPR